MFCLWKRQIDTPDRLKHTKLFGDPRERLWRSSAADRRCVVSGLATSNALNSEERLHGLRQSSPTVGPPRGYRGGRQKTNSHTGAGTGIWREAGCDSIPSSMEEFPPPADCIIILADEAATNRLELPRLRRYFCIIYDIYSLSAIAVRILFFPSSPPYQSAFTISLRPGTVDWRAVTGAVAWLN